MRLANLTAFKHPAQVAGGMDLAAMRSRLMNTIIKRNVGSTQSVERHGTDYIGGINQSFSREQRQRSHRQHCLRAVDQ